MASEISETNYATHTKQLLGLVNQLRALGAQSDLDLPRITVIGNQSAGKSSVVEAISGINVPRDAGTCTRCPMECRLSSSSGPWSCSVSIRREYDNAGKRLHEVSETKFGEVITEKADVELALRRAQLAVLNPHIPHAKILSSSLETLKEWSAKTSEAQPFSRNVVCVDLEGPDLTDLSFIDLPGLIQNAEPEIVKLVEDMVVSHIQGECLILVALPMTDDIENQKALRLARQADPEGRRTIGVMTKPDMLTSGSTKSLDLWLDVIEGRRHPLAHGYYCTRQPNDAERSEDITNTRARELETAFFRDTLPWSSSTHSQRFGTDNLIATLSRLLVRVINTTLPKIRDKAKAGLEICMRELATIPVAIEEEPATHMLTLITALSSEVDAYVQGKSDASRLVHDNRAAYGALKIAIRRTAPNFVPHLKKDARAKAFVNSLEDGEEDLLDGPGMEHFDLTDMRRHIQNSITRELPNNVPFEAKVRLITEFQRTWWSVVDTCAEEVKRMTLSVLIGCIDRKFMRYDLLRAHLRTFLSELIDKHYSACNPMLSALLEMETLPFTQNTHYLESCTEKWLAKYKDARAGKVALAPEPAAKRPKLAAPAPGAPSPAAPNHSIGEMPSFKAPPAAFTFTPGETNKASGSFGVNTNGFPPSNSPFSAYNAGAFALKPTFGGSVFSGGNVAPAARVNGGSESQSSWSPSSQPAQASQDPSPAPSAPTRNEFAFTPSIPGHQVRSPADEEKIKAALATLAELGYDGLTAEDLGKLNPPDEYATELQVMAEVRGYFQIAYKRVIDNIPSFIDLKFVRAVSKELQAFLIAKFGLGTVNANNRCAHYLAEDPSLIARRDELLARKKRLISVQQELDNFVGGARI